MSKKLPEAPRVLSHPPDQQAYGCAALQNAGKVGETRGLTTALKEFIDNSLSAGADRLEVMLLYNLSGQPLWVVADNGSGMAVDNESGEASLQKFLTLFASSKHQPKGLNMHGVGAKRAGYYLSSKMDVYTQSAEHQQPQTLFYKTTLDFSAAWKSPVQVYKDAKLTGPPDDPSVKILEQTIASLLEKGKGWTVIVLRQLKQSVSPSLLQSLYEHLAMTYYFMLKDCAIVLSSYDKDRKQCFYRQVKTDKTVFARITNDSVPEKLLFSLTSASGSKVEGVIFYLPYKEGQETSTTGQVWVFWMDRWIPMAKGELLSRLFKIPQAFKTKEKRMHVFIFLDRDFVPSQTKQDFNNCLFDILVNEYRTITVKGETRNPTSTFRQWMQTVVQKYDEDCKWFTNQEESITSLQFQGRVFEINDLVKHKNGALYRILGFRKPAGKDVFVAGIEAENEPRYTLKKQGLYLETEAIKSRCFDIHKFDLACKNLDKEYQALLAEAKKEIPSALVVTTTDPDETSSDEFFKQRRFKTDEPLSMLHVRVKAFKEAGAPRAQNCIRDQKKKPLSCLWRYSRFVNGGVGWVKRDECSSSEFKKGVIAIEGRSFQEAGQWKLEILLPSCPWVAPAQFLFEVVAFNAKSAEIIGPRNLTIDGSGSLTVEVRDKYGNPLEYTTKRPVVRIDLTRPSKNLCLLHYNVVLTSSGLTLENMQFARTKRNHYPTCAVTGCQCQVKTLQDDRASYVSKVGIKDPGPPCKDCKHPLGAHRMKAVNPFPELQNAAVKEISLRITLNGKKVLCKANLSAGKVHHISIKKFKDCVRGGKTLANGTCFPAMDFHLVDYCGHPTISSAEAAGYKMQFMLKAEGKQLDNCLTDNLEAPGKKVDTLLFECRRKQIFRWAENQVMISLPPVGQKSVLQACWVLLKPNSEPITVMFPITVTFGQQFKRRKIQETKEPSGSAVEEGSDGDTTVSDTETEESSDSTKDEHNRQVQVINSKYKQKKKAAKAEYRSKLKAARDERDSHLEALQKHL